MMFTGGNRKRTGNGNSNNSSQRSRSRGHQEVKLTVINNICYKLTVNAYRIGKKIPPIAISIGTLRHLRRRHPITTQIVHIRPALQVVVPQLQVGHTLT